MLAVITFMGGDLMGEDAERPPTPPPPTKHVSIRDVIAIFLALAGFISAILALKSPTDNLAHGRWLSWLLLFCILVGLFGAAWLISWSAKTGWGKTWLRLAQIGVGAILLMVLAGVIVGDVGIWLAVPGKAAASPAPDADIVTGLMSEEVEAAMAHDVGSVSRIYDQNAVVMDAACGSPGGARIWMGLGEIIKRYQGLGRYTSLRHVGAEVQWQPDNSMAHQATVTAQTVGEMGSGGRSLQPVYGNEVWTFALRGGRWVITSFIYHVCLRLS
jgi:hypothetical protein